MLWMYRRWHDWALITDRPDPRGVGVLHGLEDRAPRTTRTSNSSTRLPTFSWPSGHIAAAVVFYVGLATVVFWNTRVEAVRAVVFAVDRRLRAVDRRRRLPALPRHALRHRRRRRRRARLGSALVIVRTLLVHARDGVCSAIRPVDTCVQCSHRRLRPGVAYLRGRAELVLGPMLRHVGETSATICVEADASCVVDDPRRAHPHVHAWRDITTRLVIVEDLAPDSTIAYEVRLDDERLLAAVRLAPCRRASSARSRGVEPTATSCSGRAAPPPPRGAMDASASSTRSARSRRRRAARARPARCSRRTAGRVARTS